MSRERFKVTIKDQVTGEKLTYHVHSAGYHFSTTVKENKTQVVRMMLDYPRTKVKNGKSSR